MLNSNIGIKQDLFRRPSLSDPDAEFGLFATYRMATYTATWVLNIPTARSVSRRNDMLQPMTLRTIDTEVGRPA